MTGRLRAYEEIDDIQHLVMDEMYACDQGLLLLPTGFGKTVVGLTVGEELRRDGVIRRPLVLAPLRVAQTVWPSERFEWEHLKDTPMVEWGGEPSIWADSLWKQSRILYGQRLHIEQRLPKIVDVKERRRKEGQLDEIIAEERRVNKAIRQAEPPEAWHVTSFENIGWLTDLYKPGESPFDLWIIDETGKVARNPKSPRYKALAKHVPLAKLRYGFNATPAPEGLEDLFGQVRIIDGGKLWGRSFYSWRQKYFAPADYNGYSWRPQLGAFDILMKDLNTLAFKVPAEALSYQKTIRHSAIHCQFPDKARAAYNSMAKEMAVELATGDPVVAMSEGSASMKLRQICQGYLYETGADGRRIVHHMHDEKLNALSDLIDSMGREPLLIAYQFDEDLANIRKLWKNLPWLGEGVTSTQAAENITRWNKRELPIMAVHPFSASHGLNLQYGGHHICWLALPWGLDPYTQTNERLDRRGQEHACFGHHIVMEDSKDDDVSEALRDKHATQEKVIAAIRSV